MKGRVCSSIRDAIHATATSNGQMKPLAAELDWSPSEFSRRTTLGEDNTLTFPADDRLIRLQQLTHDYSVLMTMADLLGFDLRPKENRFPELLAATGHQVAELVRTFEQLRLMVPLADSVPAGKRGR